MNGGLGDELEVKHGSDFQHKLAAYQAEGCYESSGQFSLDRHGRNRLEGRQSLSEIRALASFAIGPFWPTPPDR
ncbi:MAG: hypothetical protein U0931_35885 [Vulcanimicrobiota bacterium]